MSDVCSGLPGISVGCVEKDSSDGAGQVGTGGRVDEGAVGGEENSRTNGCWAGCSEGCSVARGGW